jgi:hypothetical protein
MVFLSLREHTAEILKEEFFSASPFISAKISPDGKTIAYVVAEKESWQIYESMKKRQMDVNYILFPDEGHRIAKFSNKMMYLDHAERFLSHHLGGKYQSVDKDILADSSAIISS